TPAGAGSPHAAEALDLLGNVTLLELPVQVTTLVSAVRTALRARQRQYQLRDQIAAEQRALDALRQTDERLRLMVESVQDYALFTLDVERRVTSWNPGAERLFGYREEEIL